jgi:hypothetical protein
MSQERLNMELELLEAMYPGQTSFDPRSQDLKFTDNAAVLELRLPELYPDQGLPDVVGARGASKDDLRDQMKEAIADLGLVDGEEALDAIIAAFQSLLASTASTSNSQTGALDSKDAAAQSLGSPKTVIIWIHHLLALSKRKLALSPPSSTSAMVSGVTKPGYPGVMVFSGPESVVDEHVNTLKAENWQAFQVRYAEEELWEFTHGSGVREMETMAEVVQAVGEKRKENFLKAVGIK